MWCQHRCILHFYHFSSENCNAFGKSSISAHLIFPWNMHFSHLFFQEHALLHASFYLVHPSLDIWVYAHVIGETNIWEIQIIFSTMGLHGIFSARSLCDQSTCIYGTITIMETILSWNWLPNRPDTKFYDWKIINSIRWWWFSLVS